MISAILLNWEREEGPHRICAALDQHDRVGEIIVWNNNPARSAPGAPSRRACGRGSSWWTWDFSYGDTHVLTSASLTILPAPDGPITAVNRPAG